MSTIKNHIGGECNVKTFKGQLIMRLNINNTILTVFGIALAIVSILCEMLLFMSFAQTELDKILYSIAAFGLVGCQFIFVSTIIKLHTVKSKLVWFVWLALCALFVVSVTGSAVYFESGFSQDVQQTTNSSFEYKTQLNSIEILDTQINAITLSANSSTGKGNSWASGQQLDGVSELIKTRQTLIESLKNIEQTPSNSGGVLGGALGQKRWVFWLILAVLLDACPLLCFASLSVLKRSNTQKPNNTKTLETPTQTAQTPKTLEKTAEQTPKTNELIKQVSTVFDKKTQAVETPIATPANHATPDKTQQIKQAIINGDFTKTPSMRAIMKTHKITNYDTVKALFNELEIDGKIKRAENKRTWELI